MAPNKRLLAERGQKVGRKEAQHPGGMLAGIKAIRPGKHRAALMSFRQYKPSK